MTTLYPNKISVKDIDILAPLDTKAKTVAGAINEIYPGGPVNIQHATVVLPKDQIDILYDYTVVMHTHSNRVGYGKQNVNIYAQGYKMASFPQGAELSKSEYRKTPSNSTYMWYEYYDVSDFKSTYPHIELRNSFSGKFCTYNICYEWEPESDYDPNWKWFNSISTQHSLTEVGLSIGGSEAYRETWKVCFDGKPIHCGGSGAYANQQMENTVFARLNHNPGTSQMFLTWIKIHSPSTKSDFNLNGFGFVEGAIRGFYVGEINYDDGTGVKYGCVVYAGIPEGNFHDRNAWSIRIPFASQAEYEAAVNLISVDQKLYEIEQNKSTSS